MLFLPYPFASFCLIAALGLAVALSLRILDRKLRLLAVTPSPVSLCKRILTLSVQKLNRHGRSSKILKNRGRIICWVVLISSFIFGYGLTLLLSFQSNEYLEPILLGLLILGLPESALRQKKVDASTELRDRVELHAVTLLSSIIAPIFGWTLLGWGGVILMISFAALQQVSLSLNTAISEPIRRWNRLLLFIPGLITVSALSLAAMFTSKAKPLAALRAGLEHMPTPYRAVLQTVAESTGLALGGPKSRYQNVMGAKWLGKGTARLQQADLTRWYWLSAIAQLLLIFTLLMLSLLL